MNFNNEIIFIGILICLFLIQINNFKIANNKLEKTLLLLIYKNNNMSWKYYYDFLFILIICMYTFFTLSFIPFILIIYAIFTIIINTIFLKYFDILEKRFLNNKIKNVNDIINYQEEIYNLNLTKEQTQSLLQSQFIFLREYIIFAIVIIEYFIVLSNNS